MLQISTTDSHISTFGSFAERGSFKWSRGLMAGNGNIFGIPARAKSVLKISPTTKEVSTFGTLPEGKWKWHGAVVAPDGAIYCIPAEAESVLRIDPESDRAETIGDKMPGRWKWYGGLLGSDGCIYGMPYYANSVLKIDPQTGKIRHESCSVPGTTTRTLYVTTRHYVYTCTRQLGSVQRRFQSLDREWRRLP